MGKNQRERKQKRLAIKDQLKVKPKTFRQKVKESPYWVQFVYRFVMSFVILLPFALIGFWLVSAKKTNNPSMNNNKSIATIITDFGEIKLELFEKEAPKTVENFQKLAVKKYYEGIVFHRVIQDFMIQAGDPNCNNPTEIAQCGAGGESAWGAPFADEFNDHKIVAGTLAMANSGPNTNGSQFFIVTEKEQPHLDGKHTVFGQVIEGMEVVKAIAAVEVDENDRPIEDVKIKEVKIEK